MTRLPLRIRLTLLVTILFGLALSATAVVSLARIESSLQTDIRNNAEALLVGYFDQLLGGSIGPGDPAPEDATRFVYLDDQGNDLTTLEYQRVLLNAVATQVEDLPFPELPDSFPVPPELLSDSPIIVESGAVQLVIQPITRDGEPVLLDRGDNVITVGIPVQVGDTPLTIAVSSPLQPVTDSLNTLTRSALVIVPGLILAIAAATWIIVGRALRPVDAITAHVDRISTESLDQRVPEPGADDELGHLAVTMNRMLARLQHARDAQRQFISDASHELRSPITATQATLEVARSHADRADWTATADILHQENVRLATLVDDLLLLAQLDETSSPLVAQDVDLDELCLAEANRPHPTSVRVHVDAPARIRGNPQNLARAIRNLVDNASRHATSRVDITISLDHTTAAIEVADDGPSIPPADLERVFDRFSRLDTSRSRALGGGAGLGLAISKHIVTAHNGALTASNRTNGGARFTLTIPRHPPVR